MTWVRLEPGFPRHPKTLGIGPLGRELFVAALCRCNEFLTDGRISLDELRLLGHYEGLFSSSPRVLPGMFEPVSVDDVIESLIAAQLVSLTDGFVFIHDYTDFQPSKAQRLEQRELWRKQKQRQRGREPGPKCPHCTYELRNERLLAEHLENVHGIVEALPF
jgi:hypothetical protein